MERTPVESSLVASVGYDPAKSTLEIEFQSGRVYRYFRVPKSVYDDLMKAESKGSYFNANIKGGYSYAKVR